MEQEPNKDEHDSDYDEESEDIGEEEDLETGNEHEDDDQIEIDDEMEEDVEDDAVHVFTGHTAPVYSVACSPTKMGLVASGGGDDVAYLWKIGEDEEHTKLEGHSDSVSCVEFSKDGKFLATGGLDGTVIVWRADNGHLEHRLEGPGGGVEWVSWHPRGNILLAGCEDFTCWMWNAELAQCMSVFTGHSGSVTCGSFTNDGKLVVTGSADCSLKIWNPKTGENVTVSGYGFHTEPITSCHVSADSLTVITGSMDNRAALVSVSAGKAIGFLEGHEDSVETVGICPVLPLAATGSMDKRVTIWDINSRQARSTIDHPDGVVKLLWNNSSPIITTACLDGCVRIVDARTAVIERTFHGHSDGILDLATTLDGSFILTGSDDSTARVFGI